MGRRQALWDLETTKTTFNNNFILRASLEQSDGKTSGWWFGVVVLATKNAKGAKREEDSDFLCLDIAEDVVAKHSWPAKELLLRT